jgi:membrane-associated phospholipid phosphatase
VVALSRIHTKIHHASDVVGGIAIGLVLGQVARRIVPLKRPTARQMGT